MSLTSPNYSPPPLPCSETQWPALPQSQETRNAAIWPTKAPQLPVGVHSVLPSSDELPRRSTESTARMSFSASSLNRFSLHRTKSKGNSLSQPEQPPPLPTSTPVKPPTKRKTLEVKAATGSLKGVHRRTSGVERRVSVSNKQTSSTLSRTPPRTPTRLTHSQRTSQIPSQAQVEVPDVDDDDTDTPLPQQFTPSAVLKPKRSFFRRMADRLTRSRTNLRDEYNDKEISTHNTNDATRQCDVEMIDEVMGSPRSRQITPSPSYASLRLLNPLSIAQSSSLPSPSVRSQPPSPHPPPTHALPPTPISSTVSHPWEAFPSPPTDPLPPTPTSTRSRKSRPPAIKVPGAAGLKQDAVLAVGDEAEDPRSSGSLYTPSHPNVFSDPISSNSLSLTRDLTSISPNLVLHNPSAKPPPSVDTRAPLPMSFPLPPMSPPGSVPSPRVNTFKASRSFTSLPTAFFTPTSPTATTPRKAASVRATPPPSSGSCIPRRKAESARGGEVVEKGLDIPRKRPEPLGTRREEPATFEKTKVRERAATIGEREVKREGGRSRANSHARADSHTLAGFDLQMQMQAASVQAATPPPPATPRTVAQTRAQQRIENHLLALATEQDHCRADSPTIPLPATDKGQSAVKLASALASPSSPRTSNPTALKRCPRTQSRSSSSGFVNGSSGDFTLHGSSVLSKNNFVHTDKHVLETSFCDDENRTRVSQWLAESPTEMTAESSIDHASLNVWREALIREDDDDDLMPEVERMALEAEDRARQGQEKGRGTIVKNAEDAKTRRSLFGRREKSATSPKSCPQHLPRILIPSPTPSYQSTPRSPTPSSPSMPWARPPVSPRMHTPGSILLQAKDIADPESRRISEMVFLS